MSDRFAKDRVVVDFLARLMEDSALGEARPLKEYLALYPGYEEDIARAFLGTASSEPEVVDEGSSGPFVASTRAGDVVVGNYRIIRELGRGGQGIVLLADDLRMQRQVALKVLHQRAVSSDDALLRFRREAEVAARLHHEGICPVYDVGRDGATAYIAMRWLVGETLQRRLAASERPSDEVAISAALGLIERVARALHAAHESGVIHRDVKPGNIMIVENEQPVLMDFGLALDEASGAPTLTAAGDVFGTPAYMAPEQIRAGSVPVDRRVDVWALGVVLFQSLTRQLPFDAPTAQGIADLVRDQSVPNARRLNPGLPKDVQVVLETAMEKDLSRRYGSALALADELARVQRNEPVRARPAGAWIKTSRWVQRNRLLAGSLLLLLVSLLGGLTASLVLYGESEGNLEQAEQNYRQSAERLSRWQRLSDLRAARLLIEAEEDLHPAGQALVPALEAWMRKSRAVIERGDEHRRVLSAMPAGGEEPASQGSPADRESPAVLIELYTELIGKLAALEKAATRVSARLEASRTLLQRSVGEHQEAWDRCLADLRNSKIYTFDEDPEPQEGLVPLGKWSSDSRSTNDALWCFWHLASGSRPEWDETRKDWIQTDVSGMVLVLIPAGSYEVGTGGVLVTAVPDHEKPVHTVELDRYLISKTEATQGHWMRLTQEANPAHYHPGYDGYGVTYAPEEVRNLSLRNPVENVSWFACQRVAKMGDLELPTEVQWEVASRAEHGTEFPYFVGDDPRTPRLDVLSGVMNVLSEEVPKDRWTHGRSPAIRDGKILSCAVQSFRPNGFGLYDTLGNVAEWCRDPGNTPYAQFSAARGDGFRAGSPGRATRILRGGSFFQDLSVARCGFRNWSLATLVSAEVGVRFSRDWRGSGVP